MATTADIKNGMCINHNGGLWLIIEFLHVKPGKGAAFVRTNAAEFGHRPRGGPHLQLGGEN